MNTAKVMGMGILIMLLLVGAGFWGGMAYQSRHAQVAVTTSKTTDQPSTVHGVLTSKTDSELRIRTSTGSVTTVSIGKGTVVEQITPRSLSVLQPQQDVVVSGMADSHAKVTSQVIQFYSSL